MARDAAFRDFLRDHPEWRDEARDDPDLGMLGSTNCMLAFAVWALETGRGDPEKCRQFIRDFEGFVEKATGKDGGGEAGKGD